MFYGTSAHGKTKKMVFKCMKSATVIAIVQLPTNPPQCDVYVGRGGYNGSTVGEYIAFIMGTGKGSKTNVKKTPEAYADDLRAKGMSQVI